MEKNIIDEWVVKYPVLNKMMSYEPLLWFNPNYNFTHKAMQKIPFSISDMIDAEARMIRFQPFIEKAFNFKGLIESPLIHLNKHSVEENIYLKGDHALPISGSVKARGGIYEILRYTEQILFKHDLLNIDDDYSILMDEHYQRFLNKYEIVVSSTGNLGLSIGIISAKLGFKVIVHMSHDAMQWKKDMLRELGVTVVEHTSDYSQAVLEGRAASDKKDNSYFVDDENSINLFMGYAVAGLRLRSQLKEINRKVTLEQPLFVYIPCGVGGGPGGICYGLKQVFGDLVHVIFVEPTHAPCMLLGMATETHDKFSVQDFNMDNITIADGLAVGRASKFVGKTIEELLMGIATVNDEELLTYLKKMVDTYDIALEPSALAGFKGLDLVKAIETDLHSRFVISKDHIKNGTHVVWSTGGNMVPEDIKKEYYNKANK